MNYLSMLVAAVASMVLGYIWYGPLFGKQYLAYMGWSPEKIAEGKKKGMSKGFVMGYVASAVFAYVIAYFAVSLGIADAAGAVRFAFWAWLGFSASRAISMVTWEGKPWGLYFLHTGYDLVNLVVMTLIIAVWM